MEALNLSLVPLVKKLQLRSQLGSDEIDAVLALPLRLVRFDPGVYLVRQGDVVDNCCLILSGYASRDRNTGHKSKQILSIHLRGDLVDLHNNAVDEADYDVQALTQVTAAYLPRRSIFNLSETYPAIRRALWLDTLADMSISREWLLNVGRRSAIERVAHLICEIVLRQEAAEISAGPVYDWPMTQEQFGDATGLTSVHVNRMLKILRGEELISCSKGQVTILDWAGLKKRAEFAEAYVQSLNSIRFF